METNCKGLIQLKTPLSHFNDFIKIIQTKNPFLHFYKCELPRSGNLSVYLNRHYELQRRLQSNPYSSFNKNKSISKNNISNDYTYTYFPILRIHRALADKLHDQLFSPRKISTSRSLGYI